MLFPDTEEMWLSSHCLEQYDSIWNWRHMLYTSDFDYVFYTLLHRVDAETKSCVRKKLVFDMERISEPGKFNTFLVKYLVVPLTFYKRSDNKWVLYRNKGFVAIMRYSSTDEKERVRTETPGCDIITRTFYERVINRIRHIAGMRFVRLQGPKTARRTRELARKLLDRVLPSDVASLILERVYSVHK